jgi:hypothetical protein
MKKLVFGTFLMILVCLTLTLPSVRADNGQTLTLTYIAWNIEYTINTVIVARGQSANLDVVLTANVEVHDLNLQVVSTPGSSLITDNTWGFEDMRPTEQQHQTFTVTVVNI